LRFRDPLNRERRFIPWRLDVSSPTRFDDAPAGCGGALCQLPPVRFCREALRQGNDFVQETSGNWNATPGSGSVDIISPRDIVAL
jgi:hypothetical protein